VPSAAPAPQDSILLSGPASSCHPKQRAVKDKLLAPHNTHLHSDLSAESAGRCPPTPLLLGHAHPAAPFPPITLRSSHPPSPATHLFPQPFPHLSPHLLGGFPSPSLGRTKGSEGAKPVGSEGARQHPPPPAPCASPHFPGQPLQKIKA